MRSSSKGPRSSEVLGLGLRGGERFMSEGLVLTVDAALEKSQLLLEHILAMELSETAESKEEDDDDDYEDQMERHEALAKIRDVASLFPGAKPDGLGSPASTATTASTACATPTSSGMSSAPSRHGSKMATEAATIAACFSYLAAAGALGPGASATGDIGETSSAASGYAAPRLQGPVLRMPSSPMARSRPLLRMPSPPCSPTPSGAGQLAQSVGPFLRRPSVPPSPVHGSRPMLRQGSALLMPSASAVSLGFAGQHCVPARSHTPCRPSIALAPQSPPRRSHGAQPVTTPATPEGGTFVLESVAVTTVYNRVRWQPHSKSDVVS